VTLPSSPASPTPRRIGLALRVLAIAFLLADGLSQVLATLHILEAAAEIGYPVAPEVWQGIGGVLLVSTLLYAIPRTAVLGVLLVIGFLGGAISAHGRVGAGASLPIGVSLVIVAVVWGSQWLRDPRVRALGQAR
jgi:hypothetical protein